MSDTPDRLTILEMEYQIVAARLHAIDAQLVLLTKQTGDLTVKLDAVAARLDRFADSTDRKLDTIIDHLGLGGTQ